MSVIFSFHLLAVETVGAVANSDGAAPPTSIDVELLVTALTIFVLAVFVGVEVITKVPPTLHTPLMSGSNAISGITLVGAVLCVHEGREWITGILAFLAVSLAMSNVVGGFLVTHRMLGMFKRK